MRLSSSPHEERTRPPGAGRGSRRQFTAYLYYLLAQRMMGFIISCEGDKGSEADPLEQRYYPSLGAYSLVPLDGGKKALPTGRHSACGQGLDCSCSRPG